MVPVLGLIALIQAVRSFRDLVKPVVSASTPVPAAEKGLSVALVSSQESSFQVVQRTYHFVQVACAP